MALCEGTYSDSWVENDIRGTSSSVIFGWKTSFGILEEINEIGADDSSPALILNAVRIMKIGPVVSEIVGRRGGGVLANSPIRGAG